MSSARKSGSSGSRQKKSPSSSSSKTIDQLGLRQCVQQRLVKDVFEQAAGRFFLACCSLNMKLVFEISL
jgi:hypothetical protein